MLGGIDTAYILNEPQYGTVTLNLDCSATYNAGDEFCEREDTYVYVICNPSGFCDTATVHIWIECDDIVIFTAISPNGDGLNDLFRIECADFKSVNLKIFNRWGDLVYEADNYNNNWDGKHDGADLPPGPYYYIFEETGGAAPAPTTGCVSIAR